MRKSPYMKDERESNKRSLCPYCHSSHLQSEVSDGICPKMRPFAMEQQKKYSIVCSKCQGEGSFEEMIETKLFQSAKKYEERYKKWMANSQNGQNQIEKPERRLVKQEVKTRQLVCEECEGGGTIQKMIYKRNDLRGNRNRQSRQNYQATVSLNPVWVRYRMKPRKAKGPFHCPICIQQGGTTHYNFILNCKHQFHYGCIFRWMKTSQKCPVCREIDPYIDHKLIDQEIVHERNVPREEVRPSSVNRPLNYFYFDHLAPFGNRHQLEASFDEGGMDLSWEYE